MLPILLLCTLLCAGTQATNVHSEYCANLVDLLLLPSTALLPADYSGFEDVVDCSLVP